MKYLIKTERLGLRNWTETDLDDLLAVNDDPEVMRHFPATLNREETRNMIERFQRHYERHGYTYFALDRLDTGECVGFTGLANQSYAAYFTPCVDIGWRLKRSAWGLGFATEAARGCLAFAFETAGLSEVIAVAVKANLPSIRVMEKIGMVYDGSFRHPALGEYPELEECVVYRTNKIPTGAKHRQP